MQRTMSHKQYDWEGKDYKGQTIFIKSGGNIIPVFLVYCDQTPYLHWYSHIVLQ